MYVIDDQIFYGSANLTNTGFQLTDYPNYEILTSTIMDSTWEEHLAELITNSQLVDDSLYDFFADKAGQLPPPEKHSSGNFLQLALLHHSVKMSV